MKTTFHAAARNAICGLRPSQVVVFEPWMMAGQKAPAASVHRAAAGQHLKVRTHNGEDGSLRVTMLGALWQMSHLSEDMEIRHEHVPGISRRASLRATLRGMKAGQWFVLLPETSFFKPACSPRDAVLEAARAEGVRVKTRKLERGGWTVQMTNSKQEKTP